MVKDPQPRSDSRRRAQRAPCNFVADISFGGVFLSRGIIKNMSLSGLRLLIPNKAWLPSEFEVASEIFDAPRKVRTVWVNKEHVGVTFDDA